MSFLGKFKNEFEGLTLGGPEGSPSHQSTQQSQGGGYPVPAPYQQYAHNQQQQQPSHYQAFQYPDQQQVQWPTGNVTSPEKTGYQPPASAPPGFGQHPGHHPGHDFPPSGPPPMYAGHQDLMAPPPGPPGSHSPSPAPLVPYGALPQSGPPCPTPPRWIPYYSEPSRQWYFVETTGRSSWDAPGNLPPLPAMPPYPGISSLQVAGPVGAPPSQFDSRNSSAPPEAPPSEKSSSHTNTILAAAGGFAVGGVAGYFIKDRVDKRKAKKRHGRKREDFEDLMNYPGLEQDRYCDICDQTCYGPYARCQDCDEGDYDICRGCLAGGALCKGKGKHRLIKIFPIYVCDHCDQDIRGDFYHCSICNNGEYDVCQKCLDRGKTCNADGGHQLDHLFIPPRTQSKDDDSSEED